MESRQLLEGSASLQQIIESPIRHAIGFQPTEKEFKSPKRPLRSHSRKHRSLQLDHRYAPLNTPPASDDSSQSRPRLRRTQAFSDLTESVRSAFDPVVSVFVAKEEWLEHSIAKTKKIIGDKETVEHMTSRVRGVPSFESLDLSEHSPQLRRKRKSEALRFEYGSENSDEARCTPNPSSPFSSDGTGSPNPGYDCTTSVTRSSKSSSSFDRARIDFICVCGRACNFSPGELVLCAACGEWLSVEYSGETGKGAAILDEGSTLHPAYDDPR